MTPHASRATLLAAQLLCCLKVTMLVPKLRLVHQCDSSRWAKQGLQHPSALQAASTGRVYLYSSPGGRRLPYYSRRLAAGGPLKVCTHLLSG